VLAKGLGLDGDLDTVFVVFADNASVQQHAFCQAGGKGLVMLSV